MVDSDSFDLQFSIEVPEMHTATRAMGAESIVDLYLYIFDENGYLSQVKPATLLGGNTFQVEDVYSSQLKRTIHFIANLPDNAKTTFGSEQELINTMYTEGTDEAFWQFMTFESGINSATVIQNVPLVRNYAQVTLNTAAVASKFTNAQFVLANTPDRGTVAPYIVSGQTYAKYPIVVEDPTKAYETITATGYFGHEPGGMILENTTFAAGGDGGRTFDANPKYLYEHNQVDTNMPTYAIIKGTFNGVTSYYKIDLIDDNHNYLNILRNFEYRIVVKDVMATGYSSAKDAAEKAASNNINYSIETKDLTNITNGTEALYVSDTQLIVTDNNDFTIKFKYIPNIANKDTTSNHLATIALSTATDDNPAVVSSYDVADTDVDGWRTITFKSTGVASSAKTQVVTITAGELARTVELILTEPFKLEGFDLYQAGRVVGNVLGSDADVVITLPEYLYEAMFPLEFNIVADKLTLTPNVKRNTLPVVTNLKSDGTEGGRFYGFKATIEWDDYATVGADGKITYNKVFPFYFLTNTATSAATITAYNMYFGSTSLTFTNGTVPAFTLAALGNATNRARLTLPNGLTLGDEEEVTLTYYPVDATITAATNGATVRDGRLFISATAYANAKQFDLTFNCPNGATYVTVSHPGMRSASIEIQ